MRLKEKYQKEIIPALIKKFNYENPAGVPKVKKVTVNVGINSARNDAKFLDAMENVLERITGQKPVKCRAKKSVSNFKIREGMVVGMKVTLRGQRMYDFLEKLIAIALPRVRDFRGISKNNVDEAGNLNIGFKEYTSFPEINADEVEHMHGLEVSITTNAETKEKGEELFKLLGFPFKD